MATGGSGSPTLAAMPTASAKSMGGMGGGTGCKISMLFNLNTIDACFLSSQWRITSSAMFAGSCIGVFLLTLSLEFLRRSIKEYDRYLVRQHVSKCQAVAVAVAVAPATASSSTSLHGANKTPSTAITSRSRSAVPPFRPNVLQQAIRAFLHMLAFFVGYILMLLAMYYNGYLLLCIFLGAFFGAFIFQWEALVPGGDQTSAAQETTLCCG
ncbi:hypothetical protein C2857_007824 [Epichloe festucae Fl1]|uniref:Copper transport protein n=1 Tax=Epichloe festucae (strain Fl1) TaxID=877507 RepID=A0A7S9KMT1_EPIFF|nr:hypothetical protein C2857_007824 [Epichloe festucae Fl1]